MKIKILLKLLPMAITVCNYQVIGMEDSNPVGNINDFNYNDEDIFNNYNFENIFNKREDSNSVDKITDSINNQNKIIKPIEEQKDLSDSDDKYDTNEIYYFLPSEFWQSETENNIEHTEQNDINGKSNVLPNKKLQLNLNAKPYMPKFYNNLKLPNNVINDSKSNTYYNIAEETIKINNITEQKTQVNIPYYNKKIAKEESKTEESKVIKKENKLKIDSMDRENEIKQPKKNIQKKRIAKEESKIEENVLTKLFDLGKRQEKIKTQIQIQENKKTTLAETLKTDNYQKQKYFSQLCKIGYKINNIEKQRSIIESQITILEQQKANLNCNTNKTKPSNLRELIEPDKYFKKSNKKLNEKSLIEQINKLHNECVSINQKITDLEQENDLSLKNYRNIIAKLKANAAEYKQIKSKIQELEQKLKLSNCEYNMVVNSHIKELKNKEVTSQIKTAKPKRNNKKG